MKLRISIDGVWSVKDFSDLYQAMQNIYALFLLSNKHKARLHNDTKRLIYFLYENSREYHRRDFSFSFLLGRLAMILDSARNPEELSKIFESIHYDYKYNIKYTDTPVWHPRETKILSQLNSIIQTFCPSPTFIPNSRLGCHTDHLLERLLVIVNEELETSSQLNVRAIQFSSPGFSDFTGIGEIVGHLKDILIKLLDTYVTRNERKLNNRILENEILEGELRIIGEKIELLKKLGYTENECRQIINGIIPSVGVLETAIDKGQIRKAEIIE